MLKKKLLKRVMSKSIKEFKIVNKVKRNYRKKELKKLM